MTSTLRHASWRYLWRHPLQLALAMLGIALGVAVVVAVDLANDSARRGFELAMEATSGQATHQIIGGPTGLDETFYSKLRIELGVRDSAPVVEAFGRARGETIHLLGVDPLAESPFRTHLGDTSDLPFDRLLTEPGTLLLATRTAARLELSTGDEFELTLAGKRHRVTLVGLLSGDNPAALDGLALCDIATAQELTEHIGRLSWIDLVLSEDAAGRALLQKIEQQLPADAKVVPSRSRQNATTQMTRAFHTNLTAMGMLALIVGMFLIYNTMSFTVLQRRGLLASLRALGVTRREVMQLIIVEALLLGLAGTLLGLLLGIALSHVLLQLVTRTINDLYFVLTVTQLQITAWPLLKALALGLLSAALAAAAPALEAAGTQPRLGLIRSTLEQRAHSLAPRLAIAGVFMAISALVLLAIPLQSLVVGFASLFLMILGLTFVTPLAVAAGSALLGRVINTRASVQARLAVRGIGASLSRTGVAIAALMLAVSTSVGVGIMIDSFRSSVSIWLAATLRADIYVTTPSFGSNRTQAQLDAAVPALLRDITGVAHISTGRSVDVESQRGLTEILALGTAADRPPSYLLKAGAAQTVWPAFTRGEVVLVSEPLAYRRDVQVGDTTTLRTDFGDKAFTVAGVYYDYDAGPGEVLIHRSLYEQHFNDRAIDGMGLYVAADHTVEDVIHDIRTRLANVEQVIVRSNKEIRTASFAIFDRTFTITGVLRLLAMLIAFVGILSALMALQLEKAREFGVLRATGTTPRQVLGMVSLQNGIIGLAAGLLAIPVGLVMSQQLIHVINRRSFGWTMQTQVSPQVLVEALALAVVAALIAGLYPAWKMAHTSPARALREE